MVGRIVRVQRPRTPAPADGDTLALWYELGYLYAESAGGGQRATKLGFAVTCVVGALVLLSVPVFGTAWAGPFAAVIPVAAGVLSGGGLLLRRRAKLRHRTAVLEKRLAERGLDGRRPARPAASRSHSASPLRTRSRRGL